MINFLTALTEDVTLEWGPEVPLAYERLCDAGEVRYLAVEEPIEFLTDPQVNWP